MSDAAPAEERPAHSSEVASDAPARDERLTGLEVLQAGGGHGLGNALYLDRAAGALLKVYRSRRGPRDAWREALRDFGHRVLEGKRGTTPAARLETERSALRLWHVSGIDVPSLIDRPVPDTIDDPALWMEFCPGETLDRALADPALPVARFDTLVARLATDHARRHALALETGETLLVQEHPTIVHTLLSGDRLVTIDFENAYAVGASIEEIVARELAGTLRSFFRRLGPGDGPREGGAAFERFVDAYPERAILADAARRATEGGGPIGRLRRSRDRGRRNRPSKVEVMERLAARLDEGAGASR